MVTLVDVAVTVMIGALLYLTPNLSRPGVPLGVSVPRDRVADPVVHRAVRQFRVGILVLTALAVIATLLLSGRPLGAGLVPIALLVLVVPWWVVARAPIVAAKRAQGWFDDTPVALVASATPQLGRVRWWPFAISGCWLAAVGAVGAVRWSRLPDPFPTHWDLSGHADAWTAKGWWPVFGPLLIAGLVLALLAVFAVLIRSSGLRQYADGTPGQGEERARATARLTLRVLELAAVLVSVTIGGLVLLAYLGATPATYTVVMVVLLLAAVGLIGWQTKAALDLNRRTSDAPGAGPDAPDDDAHWKAGLVYVNREDPAAFVPKRTGIGYTINLGSTAGLAVTGGFLLVIAVIVLVAFVNSSR